jgi:hypothetical protein
MRVQFFLLFFLNLIYGFMPSLYIHEYECFCVDCYIRIVYAPIIRFFSNQIAAVYK